jgi:serine acetyltransferase/GT2 family glycosyltransferase
VNLSVIIPTCNRALLLRRLLLQLCDQTASDFEVCVVDDGSTPEVGPALADLKAPPYALSLLRQANAGAAAARHGGAMAARGELILFLDDDMQIGRDFIEQHRRAHGGGPAVVLGRIRGDPELAGMPLFERWNASLLDRKAEAMIAGDLEPRGHLLFTGNASMRRDDYLRVGGFDRSLAQSEDVDLGLRLEKAGVPFRFCPEAFTRHGSDHTSVHKWRRRAKQYGSCDERIARKHPELRDASPWRFVFELHPALRPFLAGAVLAPDTAAAAAQLGALAAQLADKVGLRRAALSGTTLAYAVDYFRGVRDAAGSTSAALSELLDFTGRFERSILARALVEVREDQSVMRQYEHRYGHGSASVGHLGSDLVHKIGLQMMLAVRLMRASHDLGKVFAAKAVSRIIRHLYGSDIHWEARIDPGVMLVHGMGMAISREARIGRGCIVFQHVTLGMGVDPATRQLGAPTLERDVHVGPGATLIGPIRVGTGSKIMAGAVLTHSVPPGSLVESPAPDVRARTPVPAASAA